MYELLPGDVRGSGGQTGRPFLRASKAIVKFIVERLVFKGRMMAAVAAEASLSPDADLTSEMNIARRQEVR